MTHFLVAYILVQALGIREFTSLIYLGGILPDLVSRPLLLIDEKLLSNILHAPIVVALACVLISLSFEERIRRKALTALVAGSLIHLSLDAFNRHLGTGYLWLYPLSFKSFEVGLFWPEESIYALPFLAALALYLWQKNYHQRRQSILGRMLR